MLIAYLDFECMVDPSDAEAMRPYLSFMCKSQGFWENPPSREIEKHNWHPYNVLQDACRSPFTDEEAWRFIAECLDGGVAIECRGPNAEHDDYAYIMKQAEAPWGRRIYMKIAVRPPHRKVLGISFHFEQLR